MPRRRRLQRLFSTFPVGWPGLGILLLRAAAGVALLVEGISYLADWRDLRIGTVAAGVIAAGSGASLLIGFLTPIAGVMVGVGSASIALSLFPASRLNLFETRLSIILVVMAAAIVLLGPGAYSLDARLFGRREVIIPQMKGRR
jgi:uncharacterized membrane protein YphA (DoxX/SURF4 family)